MAIQFLHDLKVQGNLDLDGNELQNAILHHASVDPAVADGRIYYNTSNDVVMVCLDGTWTELSSATGDITGVTAGAGLTDGGTTGTVVLNVGQGAGMNVSADEIALLANQTVIASINNVALQMGRDADNRISFATDNEIKFRVGANNGVTFKASGEIEATKFDGDLEGNADTATVATTVTITDNESTDEDNAIIFTAGGDVNGGNIGLESDGTLTYNPSDGKITATGFVGALTGQADTVATIAGLAPNTATTQATQGAITSLGTLTALTVDDVAINGKVMTMTGSTNDTAVFTAGTNGTLTITTTDTAAAAANIQITADGTAELAGTTVTLDSSGGITLDADGGTVTFADGGSSLGTITSSGWTGDVVGDVTGTASLATVTNSTANTNFPIVFNNESDALLDDTGALYFNPSTGLLTVPNLSVAGTTTQVDTVTMNAANAVVFEGATADGYETTLSIVDPTADHIQYLTNDTGYIPLLAAATTTTITSTPAELNLLDGITTLSGSNTGDEPDADETTKGIVELATTTEALTGTDTERAVTAAGLSARSFTSTIGNGSATSIAVTHSLGTRAVIVQMFDSSSYETVYASVVRTDANTVTVGFTTAPTTNDITIMITKVQ